MFRTNIETYMNLGLSKHQLMGIRYHSDPANPPSNQPVQIPAPAPTPTPVPPVPAPAPTPTPPTPASAIPAVWDGKIESLPADAQKIITDLRKEAGDNRVKAQAILKAAGLVDDADPLEALKVRTTERDTFKTTAEEASRELAIFKAAAAAGADPTKLLDRTSFMTSIAAIPVTDGAAIAAAIKTAIDADATLKAARAAGASSVDPGGLPETGQITQEQLDHMSPEAIAAAYEKGQLKHLLS